MDSFHQIYCDCDFESFDSFRGCQLSFLKVSVPRLYRQVRETKTVYWFLLLLDQGVIGFVVLLFRYGKGVLFSFNSQLEVTETFSFSYFFPFPYPLVFFGLDFPCDITSNI